MIEKEDKKRTDNPMKAKLNYWGKINIIDKSLARKIRTF